ncbi:TetR/AcrR family transcriptional regulator [Kribbella speibonae]|uniref:TetR/AcrR family transcriptional regulator n=1 Tax=Kribbella speibonae TaxID=1572660 RepID=A0A4R0J8Q6_9ACTN|nr:TetR/AcrR family transcriptional regulator [Kribbella speibonae]TCC18066.1 TetR/AcrR family transcriptional regulator [Kribbella speibonae]TCC42080.1 TetR/AcrR family transcriptional regulator [Kribbella speibonae]
MNDSTGPRSALQRSLPVVGEPRPERADARRNRLRVLEAAERLFTERGVKNVSLDAIAAEAGVGKGTVFRRFGDRAGLAVALLDEREQELQAKIISGPPPLGPGAPPDVRVLAFLDAYLDLLDRHVALFMDSENASDGARYRIGSYHLWHRHLSHLIEAARPELDADYTAHVLLAPLAADLHNALREQGYDLTRMKAGLQEVAAVLVQKNG